VETCRTFAVSNTTRQERVLSQSLFIVCLDGLSVQLDTVRTGCTVGSMVVNYLLFSDDIQVCSPSTCDFQRLANNCCDYTAQHESVFNCNKTMK